MKKALVFALISMLMWPLLLVGRVSGQETLYLAAPEGFGPPPDFVPTNLVELYPSWGNYQLIGCKDNNGKLDSTDEIALKDEAGVTRWYYVVRDVLFFVWSEYNPEDPYTGAYIFLEMVPERPDWRIVDPISTYWHEVNPTFSTMHHITGWVDGYLSEADGFLGPGDLVYATDESGMEKPYIYDNIFVGLIVTEEPIVPEFPLGSIMFIAAIPMLFFIWLKRRQRILS